MLRLRETARVRCLDRCPAGPSVHWGRYDANSVERRRHR